MKASELKPGMFFWHEGERRLAIWKTANNSVWFGANAIAKLMWVSAEIDVTPLNVHDWDDEPQTPTGTEARVCADIAERQALGINKYGTTVECNPLSMLEWMEHAYEECLDMAVYLKRAMEEMEKPAPLQLREGAWYRDGNEHVYQVASVPVSDGDPYCFKAKGVIRWYTSSGVSCTRTKSDDLIAEVPPPVATSTPPAPASIPPTNCNAESTLEAADDFTNNGVNSLQPDADGWIEHDGKGCPVKDSSQLVVIRLIGGRTHETHANFVEWDNRVRHPDLRITHYRLVSPTPSPVAASIVKSLDRLALVISACGVEVVTR